MHDSILLLKTENHFDPNSYSINFKILEFSYSDAINLHFNTEKFMDENWSNLFILGTRKVICTLQFNFEWNTCKLHYQN